MLKALAKDREKRYQSAAELAADIRRFLKGEPIDARPPARWTKAVRWLGKHPIITTSAACLMIAALTMIATFATVRILWSRPYKIDLADDGREACLISRAGNILHTWESTVELGIYFAELVERPAELGGGTLAVVGYRSAEDNEWSGCLCVFDVAESCEEPLWTRRIEEDDLPEAFTRRSHFAQLFDARCCNLMDVFEDVPGPEIVTMFQVEVFSTCCVRIYDLQGTLLYQIWHDGNLTSSYWMSEPRLLVLAGLNGEVHWPERGHPEIKSGRDPSVVFAVNPKRNDIRTDWPLPADIAWYRCVLPPSASDYFSYPCLGRSVLGCSPERSVHVSLPGHGDPPSVGIAWDVDEDGRQIGETIEDNAYSAYPDLPPAKDFYLGDLPPIVESVREMP